ncbi:MAG: PQQ-like beta-propeller repeat protein [Holosporaceae bacterium]|nr:MAG: PQQ-like beta-propeller repeat protein [Holosporaceae bacterium]
MIKNFLSLLAVCALIFLSGCESAKEPLVGKRTELLEGFSALTPDVDADNINVTVSESILNTDWAQADYGPKNLIPHVDAGTLTNKLWSRSIGQGNGSAGFLLSTPLVQNERIFAMDAAGTVSAMNAKTGQKIWSQQLKSEKFQGCSGGGIALGQGRVFVSASDAGVAALDAETGQILWHRKLVHALRSAPTYYKGRIYVITKNNRAISLDAVTGRLLWQQEGTDHACALLGGAKPAVQGNTVIVPYSSGEIYAMRRENGFALWAEALSAIKMFSSTSYVSHIKASPVIDQDMVFALSQNGRMVGMRFRNGNIVWEREIKSTTTPLVNESFLYVVTTDQQVICLVKDSGKIIWVTSLPKPDGRKKNTSFLAPLWLAVN